MTDSIKNPSIDFRVLLLSLLPLSGPAKSILHRGRIDSGKGVVIWRSMSASAVWRREGWRSPLAMRGGTHACLHVNSLRKAYGQYWCTLGSFWLCIARVACIRSWYTWPQAAEGQTLIIRYCGATGLSPLVGGRFLWWGHREGEIG